MIPEKNNNQNDYKPTYDLMDFAKKQTKNQKKKKNNNNTLSLPNPVNLNENNSSSSPLNPQKTTKITTKEVATFNQPSQTSQTTTQTKSSGEQPSQGSLLSKLQATVSSLFGTKFATVAKVAIMLEANSKKMTADGIMPSHPLDTFNTETQLLNHYNEQDEFHRFRNPDGTLLTFDPRDVLIRIEVLNQEGNQQLPKYPYLPGYLFENKNEGDSIEFLYDRVPVKLILCQTQSRDNNCPLQEAFSSTKKYLTDPNCTIPPFFSMTEAFSWCNLQPEDYLFKPTFDTKENKITVNCVDHQQFSPLKHTSKLKTKLTPELTEEEQAKKEIKESWSRQRDWTYTEQQYGPGVTVEDLRIKKMFSAPIRVTSYGTDAIVPQYYDKLEGITTGYLEKDEFDTARGYLTIIDLNGGFDEKEANCISLVLKDNRLIIMLQRDGKDLSKAQLNDMSHKDVINLGLSRIPVEKVCFIDLKAINYFQGYSKDQMKQVIEQSLFSIENSVLQINLFKLPETTTKEEIQ